MTTRVLFLDLDGTLHPPNCHSRDHMVFLPFLAGILRRHDDVKVVISSSWRITTSLEKLRGLFPPDLRHRVVGVTPVLKWEGGRGHRQKECLAWLSENAPEAAWIALDDEAILFHSGHVVVCDPLRGLSAPQVRAELEGRLTEMVG
jgi:hypothetical protein